VATTYSRGTYRTTTIGKAVFDGRVREGIGSGHRFMVTINLGVRDEGREASWVALASHDHLRFYGALNCKERFGGVWLRRAFLAPDPSPLTSSSVFSEYYTQAWKLEACLQLALF
jgi:hypothetical protein